ncbi:hypothetical protein Pst134EA_013667 [Puccinia striiformis f. sp. tritici]|uniref:hypothetical protein n=1 Tax=Puccinia striiformis f. sp. tritici TaxID=168172 RepID=UPI0020088E22|nr:hypothetical protein Pst134EA_013667 [Puccinia striiformis f. sp. tritici]KAH9465803.1 hypothetical protein Pst134EA_013667 [Puccinia striiformis f. sp. tritici]
MAVNIILSTIPSVLPPPPLMSRPMTPISKLSVENPGPPLSNEDLIWEQKLREAEELNARIESLRQSGMPPDQLPSPVLLPSRPLSRATTRTDKPFPNCVPPRDYQNPSLPSFTSVSEAGLRRQLSKRSLHSVPYPCPHITQYTTTAAAAALPAESKPRSDC